MGRFFAAACVFGRNGARFTRACTEYFPKRCGRYPSYSQPLGSLTIARRAQTDRGRKVWNSYMAFSCFRVAAILQGVYVRSTKGQAANSQAAAVGQLAGYVADVGLWLAHGRPAAWAAGDHPAGETPMPPGVARAIACPYGRVPLLSRAPVLPAPVLPYPVFPAPVFPCPCASVPCVPVSCVPYLCVPTRVAPCVWPLVCGHLYVATYECRYWTAERLGIDEVLAEGFPCC